MGGAEIFFFFFLIDSMYMVVYTYLIMKRKRREKGHREFSEQVESLWPLAKGSVAEVRKPCIRPNCRACAEGEKHQAFIFSYKDNKGKRRCLYVPEELVPTLRQALENGRRLEELLSQLGEDLIKEHREQRGKRKNPRCSRPKA